MSDWYSRAREEDGRTDEEVIAEIELRRDAKPLTEADLLRAGEELAYLVAPVEARLTADSFIRFRVWIGRQHDPLKPGPAPTSFETLTGIRIIVDETVAPDRIEFRDQHGNVTASFEVPR